MVNFANTKPIASRTYKVGTFADGRISFAPDCTLVVGAVGQVWLDCSKQVGDHWLDSADNFIVSDDSLLVTDFDVNGRNAVVGLDASLCVAGAAIDLTCDIHPIEGQTIPGILRVNIVARAR